MGEGHLLILVGLRLGEFESQRLWFMYPSPTGTAPSSALRPQTLLRAPGNLGRGPQSRLILGDF